MLQVILAVLVLIATVMAIRGRVTVPGNRTSQPTITYTLPLIGKIFVGVLGLTLAGALIRGATLVEVGFGKVGLVTRFGALTGEVLEEGLRTKLPIDDVIVVEVATQLEKVPAAAASRDLQEAKAEVALNWKPERGKIIELFREVGPHYKERVVAPAIQEAFKATTAQYTANELIHQREKVKAAVIAALQSRLAQYYIVVDTVSLTDFDFSAAFNAAVEAAQVAARKVIEAENKLKEVEINAQQVEKQADAEARAAVTRAKGRAEAVLIEAEAQAKANERLARSLDANVLALKGYEKWNGQLPTVTGGATPFVSLPSPK